VRVCVFVLWDEDGGLMSTCRIESEAELLGFLYGSLEYGSASSVDTPAGSDAPVHHG
jgi:hypothetical protein